MDKPEFSRSVGRSDSDSGDIHEVNVKMEDTENFFDETGASVETSALIKIDDVLSVSNLPPATPMEIDSSGTGKTSTTDSCKDVEMKTENVEEISNDVDVGCVKEEIDILDIVEEFPNASEEEEEFSDDTQSSPGNVEESEPDNSESCDNVYNPVIVSVTSLNTSTPSTSTASQSDEGISKVSSVRREDSSKVPATRIVKLEELLEKPFHKLPPEVQLEIIRKGKPRPDLSRFQFTATNSNDKSYPRSFSPEIYDTIEWLGGCEKLQKLFCWPCFLFSKSNSFWTNDCRVNFSEFQLAAKKHENVRSHIDACVQLQLFDEERVKANMCSGEDSDTIARHNEVVKKNRAVMKRLIDAVCFLGKQALKTGSNKEPEDPEEDDKGNYLALLEFMREYDPILDSYLRPDADFAISSISVAYLVKAIADVIRDEIKKETEAATFVAIMVDEVSAIIDESHASVILRYVHESVVHERFWGFECTSETRNTSGISRIVENTVTAFGLKNKLVAQTYDGGLVPPNDLILLHTTVSAFYPSAVFTHCYTHDVNKIFVDSLYWNPSCRLFLALLDGIGDLFLRKPYSERAVNALKEFVSKNVPDLLPVVPINWDFTIGSLAQTVKQQQSHLIRFFDNIYEDPDTFYWCTDRISVFACLSIFEEFENVLLLEILSKLCSYTNGLQSALTNRSVSFVECAKLVTDIKEKLHEFKNGSDFDDMWESASTNKYVDFDPHQPKRTKTDSLRDKETAKQVFYAIVDTINVQLTTRYSSLGRLEFRQLLNKKYYQRYSQKFPEQSLNKLKEMYPDKMFDYNRLTKELRTLYSSPHFADKTIRQLITFVSRNNLRSTMKEVYKLAELILTLPMSPASNKKSFIPTLTRVKNYCQWTREEYDRDLNLALLSVERELLIKLEQKSSFYDDVIEKFLEQEKRPDLIYK